MIFFQLSSFGNLAFIQNFPYQLDVFGTGGCETYQKHAILLNKAGWMIQLKSLEWTIFSRWDVVFSAFASFFMWGRNFDEGMLRFVVSHCAMCTFGKVCHPCIPCEMWKPVNESLAAFRLDCAILSSEVNSKKNTSHNWNTQPKCTLRKSPSPCITSSSEFTKDQHENTPNAHT